MGAGNPYTLFFQFFNYLHNIAYAGNRNVFNRASRCFCNTIGQRYRTTFWNNYTVSAGSIYTS